MMTSALVLIAAILLLGGLLAALGDYLGTKVGKARLRIFNLRPRQTATFVTIFTGTLIATTTLGILFATSESLRKGIFRLDEYLNRLQDVREELAEAIRDREKVEAELAKAQQRLDEVNGNFQATQQELDRVSQELNQLKQQLSALKQERENLLAQRNTLEQQILEKDQELASQKKELEATEERLQTLEKQRNHLQAEIKKQDEQIAELDAIIKKRDEVLAFQEEKVTSLEKKITESRKQIQALEQYYENYQALRQGNVALAKGEVLSFAVVEIKNPQQTEEIIKQILRQANYNAIKATQPGNTNFNQKILRIRKSQIQRLEEILKTGKQYVVQIVTAGNYLTGEKKISVFADVVLNQRIFEEGETVASLSLSPQEVQQGELSERIDLLLAASRFRARRAGVVGNIFVGQSSVEVIQFLEKVAKLNQPYDNISAIASKTTYTAGPLELQLKVMQDQEVILSN